MHSKALVIIDQGFIKNKPKGMDRAYCNISKDALYHFPCLLPLDKDNFPPDYQIRLCFFSIIIYYAKTVPVAP